MKKCPFSLWMKSSCWQLRIEKYSELEPYYAALNSNLFGWKGHGDRFHPNVLKLHVAVIVNISDDNIIIHSLVCFLEVCSLDAISV